MRNILRRSQIGIPITSLWEMQKAGLYPDFFKIYGSKAAGVFADEHDRVMALRAAGATDAQVRQLVDQIHIERKRTAEAIINGGAAS